MCGRYLVDMEGEIVEYREIINEVNERYKDTPELKSMATGEVFPTNIAPVLAANAPRARLMKWGFPKWQGSGVIINARSETTLEKKMFRAPLMKHRCVIPSVGFFEWRQEHGKKAKYLFRLPDTPMLYMAGFFDTFSGSDAYVIITTQANEWMAPYHSRMPLILAQNNVDKWLCDISFALDYLHASCEAKLTVSGE